MWKQFPKLGCEIGTPWHQILLVAKNIVHLYRQELPWGMNGKIRRVNLNYLLGLSGYCRMKRLGELGRGSQLSFSQLKWSLQWDYRSSNIIEVMLTLHMFCMFRILLNIMWTKSINNYWTDWRGVVSFSVGRVNNTFPKTIEVTSLFNTKHLDFIYVWFDGLNSYKNVTKWMNSFV